MQLPATLTCWQHKQHLVAKLRLAQLAWPEIEVVAGKGLLMILTCHQGQALQEYCSMLQRSDEDMCAGAAFDVELQEVWQGVCNDLAGL